MMTETPETEELRLYLLVRGDIQMSFGKGMVQAGHAFVGVIENARKTIPETVDLYMVGQTPKISKKAKNIDALLRAQRECREAGIPTALVTDAGRTEFSEPTVTCMAIGPTTRDKLPKYVEKMQLF